MSEEPLPEATQRRISRRTQLILAGVAFTIFIGFCVIPCLLFGGISVVEQFFDRGPEQVETVPAER
ncbi:MAG: hypothetical protein ACNA8W_25980 [Bradymonadaceae bacterium]